MTEKRFVYNVNKNTIECAGKFVAYVMNVDGFRIANKMNILLQENEQLKESNERFSKTVAEQIIMIKEYREENEQLKSENNMLKVTIGRNEAYIKRLTETSIWRC